MPANLIPQNFEIVSGDNKTIRFAVVDQDAVIQDISGAAITWAFARRRTSQALVTKTIGSGITITDGAAGICEVELAQVDTELLDGDFYHELEIVDNGGRKTTAAYGTMTILQDLID